MSTDLYGVCVLAVHPEERAATLRTFVVYFEPSIRQHEGPPGDPTFFVRLLDAWRVFTPPLAGRQWDEPWLDAHAWRFVERVEALDRAHHPIEDWAGIVSFYYCQDGAWSHEDVAPRADYKVWLCDGADLSRLKVGDARGTTAYPTFADRLTAAEASQLPYPLSVAWRFRAFPDHSRDSSTVHRLQFSPDGEMLLMQSVSGQLRVVRVDDSTLVGEHQGEEWSTDDASWTTEGHVLWGESDETCTWNPHTGATTRSTGAPLFQGSHDNGCGLRRSGWECTEVVAADGTVVHRVPHEDSARVFAGFSAHASFVAYTLDGQPITWLDRSTGAATILPHKAAIALAPSPNGRFLLIGRSHAAFIVRTSDGSIVRTLYRDHGFVTGAAWCSTGRHVAVGIANPDGFETEVHLFSVPPPAEAFGPSGPPSSREAQHSRP